MPSQRVLLVGLAVIIAVGGSTVVVITQPNESSASRKIKFNEVGSEVGITYRTTGTDLGNSDGAVLVTDYNNDGWSDLLLIGGKEPTLYRNNRDGSFTQSRALPDVGVTHLKSGLFFDYDNDGWQDLLLLPRHDSPVFLKNQNGTFRQTSVGFNRTLTWGTSATAADFNNDGCLDVFITQNGDWSERLPNRSTGDPISPDNGEPNLLYRGNCSGFERVTAPSLNRTRWSLAATFVDLTGDGRPDIHVANDFNYDMLYVNTGNGSFEARRLSATNRHGMTSEVEDVNGDRRLDIFVTNIEYANPSGIWIMRNGFEVVNKGNNLLIQQRNGSFVDRASQFGVRRGGWGWSGNLVDLDNDGDLDLLHATQSYRLSTDRANKAVTPPPALWKRTNTGFQRLNSSRRGLVSANGRGLAVLDFDRDGDQDVIVADTDGPFKVYKNIGARPHWLQVVVTSAEGPVQGTRITVSANGQAQLRVVDSEINFFSQSSRVQHFGLNNTSQVDVTVQFPDGTTYTFTDVQSNQRIEVFKNGTYRSRPP